MAFRNKFKLVLAEKVQVSPTKKVHKEVGSAMIPFPTLHQDYGIAAEQSKWTPEQEKEDAAKPVEQRQGIKAGQPASENGIPIYEDPKLDWLQQAIVAAVQIKVRNKFAKGVLKPGMEIPEDFEKLTADTARTGEALKLRREARADFEAFLRSLNKKDNVVAKLSDLFWNSSKVIPTASPEYLKAISTYVDRWTKQLDNVKSLRFQPKIQELQESINSAGETEEDLMAEDVQAA